MYIHERILPNFLKMFTCFCSVDIKLDYSIQILCIYAAAGQAGFNAENIYMHREWFSAVRGRSLCAPSTVTKVSRKAPDPYLKSGASDPVTTITSNYSSQMIGMPTLPPGI